MKPEAENLPEICGLPRQPLPQGNEIPEAAERQVDRTSIRPSLQERARAEIRDHALAYSVLAVFTLAPPLLAVRIVPS